MVESSIDNDFKSKMLNKISLAPMVRMNHLPFRQLVRKYGADYVFSEEIIDRKLLACVRIENELFKTIDYVTSRDYQLVLRLQKEEKEHFILQIGTNSADTAVQATEKLINDIGGIDVNMGCPKKFSVSGGMGSALMRNLENASTIMKALVDRFGKKISVSCKIRVLKTFEDTLKYVLAMQETGVHWISIHPRTAAEESRVPARWYTIKRLLETQLIKIPILGSGDLFSPLDIHKYLSFTGANGVIIARGAIHNPQIFKLKDRMINRDVAMIDTTCEEIWKENIEESPMQHDVEEGLTKSSKKGASIPDEESIEFSTNLVKVYDKRYSRMPMETDILDQAKEFFKLCIETGNHYQNTKYCILYMLKTHKHHFDLFKQIHQSKTLFDYAKVFNMEGLFDNLPEAYFQNFEGLFYRKNKHIVDLQSGIEGLMPQQIGVKRETEELDESKDILEAKRVKM